MPRQITKYGVFIASPSDVDDARDAIGEAIDEWNQLNGVDKGIELEALRYEGNILPNIEERGQDEINRTLLSRADLVIAVFWTRIGTPTGEFGSGTLEELAKFTGPKLVYHCLRDVPQENLSQASQVVDLINKWEHSGALIAGYNDVETFKQTLVLHLNQWLAKEIQRRGPLQVFCDADHLPILLSRWCGIEQSGILLLFNIEVSTFASHDQFETFWAPIRNSDNVKRIVMVLPAHKKRRLLRYIADYRDEFLHANNTTKFEVADFSDVTAPSPPLAFVMFRFGDNANEGLCDSTGLMLILTEPFARRDYDRDINDPVWEYEWVIVAREGQPITDRLGDLLKKYFPCDRTISVRALLDAAVPTPLVAQGGPIQLPGNLDQLPVLDQRKVIRDDLFLSNVPTYVLDQNFYLLDWNVAFDLIFGHCGFHRGEYVKAFLDYLVNSEAVLARGNQFVGDPPLFDEEEFIFLSPEFGKMTFLKTTAQAIDDDGRYRGWNVALTLRSAGDLVAYKKALRAAVEYETLMETYAPAYNRIMAVYRGYQELAKAIVDALGDATKVLDAGAGSGRLAKMLAASGKYVLAVEANEAMLACLKQNCSQQIASRELEYHKANLQSISDKELTTVPSANFQPKYDGVALLNVFYAICDKPRLLSLLSRVMTPGGVLALSGPRDTVNLDIFFYNVRKDVGDTSDLQLFEKVNTCMYRTGLLRQSVTETTKLLGQNGFEVVDVNEHIFNDQGVLIVAKKKRDLQEK